MKKILLIISLIAFAFLISCKESGAQTAAAPDATMNANMIYNEGYSYANYKVTSADVFTSSRDTVDYVFNMRIYNGTTVKKVTVGIVMDLTGATDTLYSVTIFGENFDDDDYTTNTVLAASNTAAITASNTFDDWETTYTETMVGDTTALFPLATATLDSAFIYSHTITPSMTFTWRKYVVRIIYAVEYGGDGLTLDSMELKLCTF